MDREQEEVQFLGFFGIIKESANIIISRRKIFAQITLALVLPLSLIFLGHIVISESMYGEIFINEIRLLHTQMGTPRYNKLYDILASGYTAFFTFTIVYYIILLIFSLLSTSAVVYTIACIYTGKEINFRKVMRVVPKVWKRLMLTFVWSSVIICVYNFIAVLMLAFCTTFFYDIARMVFFVFFIFYLLGLIYISTVWHLANVVSVMEDCQGLHAMIKSKKLVDGKTMVAATFYTMFSLSLISIQEAMAVICADGVPVPPSSKLGYEFLCCLILVVLFSCGLVIQTIIYFVCKSYHQESIDKSTLADHLEVYIGEEYEPLKHTDIHLEQFHV
ncbi:uncharacterized protein LOC132314724 [Cornus florida]|uniref:uncharacterized protein LOC132314724 n=1 Tax=Cornus florida TaxID=4283 RepID=UPI00289A33A3|nr:uncharacterized protein LOC132314724 [Cornus florida]